MTDSIVNWRKGLFRTWVVLSFLWIGLIFSLQRPDEDIALYLKFLEAAEISENIAEVEGETVTLPSGQIVSRVESEMMQAEVYKRRDSMLRKIMGSFYAALIPCAVLLILGIAVLWVQHGFKANK